MERLNDQVDQGREDLAYERRRTRCIEGAAFSQRTSMEFIQSLIDSIQKVFNKMSDEEGALTIQMKSKRKCGHNQQDPPQKRQKNDGLILYK